MKIQMRQPAEMRNGGERHIMANVAKNFVYLASYFNQCPGSSLSKTRQLVIDGDKAIGHYDHIRLHSAFQTLFSAATLKPVAYEALLRAKDLAGHTLAPEDALRIPSSPQDVVYFDRLCRSTHAINFVYQASPDDLLFLNVSGGHLLNITNGTHGDIFESLLRHCGLRPQQIVLEILESRIDNLEKLVEAVTAYQRRGYRVAIDDFGCRHSNFDRLWKLSPDIVKLDRSLIVQSEINPRAMTILPKLVEIIHDLGALVVCEGIETPSQHLLAVEVGADLVQGFYYARPCQTFAREADVSSSTPIRE